MIKVSDIQDAINGDIVARGCFIVDIKISADNDITITVESEKSSVTLDDCVELSRIFEEKFSREQEDYSLTVTSAGLDQPFMVYGQFVKAVGTEVEVSLKGGRKFKGILVAADEGTITVSYKAREAVEGKKKKELVEHTDTFPMESVNSVRPRLEF